MSLLACGSETSLAQITGAVPVKLPQSQPEVANVSPLPLCLPFVLQAPYTSTCSHHRNATPTEQLTR